MFQLLFLYSWLNLIAHFDLPIMSLRLIQLLDRVNFLFESKQFSNLPVHVFKKCLHSFWWEKFVSIELINKVSVFRFTELKLLKSHVSTAEIKCYDKVNNRFPSRMHYILLLKACHHSLQDRDETILWNIKRLFTCLEWVVEEQLKWVADKVQVLFFCIFVMSESFLLPNKCLLAWLIHMLSC